MGPNGMALANAEREEDEMNDNDAMGLIVVLCRAGFSVEISDGYPSFDAKISSANCDLSDYASGDTPSMAVYAAAHDLFTHIENITNALRPFCEAGEPPNE